MFHLKIISASNLPSPNSKSSHLYVRVFLVNFGVQASKCIASTKKTKKIINPEWHELIQIPFVACQRLHLEILDETSHANIVKVGTTEIELSPENVDDKEHESDVKIENEDPTLKEQPKLKYLIEPCTLFPFRIKNYKAPDAFYCYLSYDPPLKSDDRVELDFGSINNEGTAIQGIENYFVSYEKEPTHIGPKGLTQVFYIPRKSFVDAQFFFYAKTYNYKGNVTLNFVYGPSDSSPKYLSKKFAQSDKNGSISVDQVSSNHVAYSVFPVMANITSSSIDFELFKIPIEVIEQIVPIEKDTKHGHTKEKEAIDKIFDLVGKQICPENKEFQRRFNVYRGIRYTIDEAFKYQNIETSPRDITVCIGWDPSTHMDSSIVPIEKTGKALEPICYFHPVNIKRGDSIRTSSQTFHSLITEDNEKIRFKLLEIDPNVQYLGIAVTAEKGSPISGINGVYCRIMDNESKKEVMFIHLPKKKEKTGVLFGILTRVNNVWNFWPCLKFFDGTNPDQAKGFFSDYIKSGVADKFLEQS